MEISERYSPSDRKLEVYLMHSFIIVVFYFVPVALKATKDGLLTSLIATCLVTSVFIMILAVCDLVLRLFRMLTDPRSEHSSSFSSMISHYFAFNTALAMVIVIGMFLFLIASTMIQGCPLKLVWDIGPYFSVPLFMFSYYLLRVTSLAEWERKPLLDLDTMKGLDYGTGMAYSFYYGYLRLVLPNRGTPDSKGISEKIENFEDTHNVIFPVHKLFILIPKSGYIPTNLKEASYQWMESAHELEEERRDRAGIIKRTYHNNAYKIYSNGRDSGASPVYVVAEGATPLLTFYEAQKHNHPESIVYKRYKSEIILMFYKKLQNILQTEPNTRNLCELIYYDDYDFKGAQVNVAKLILERISEINSA